MDNNIQKQIERWKAKSLGQIKDQVAKRFQLLIRLRYADPAGICRCITCGRRESYKTIHAGHFQPRTNSSTLFDPLNVHPQCRTCNCLKGGEHGEYAWYLREKYGKNTPAKLRKKAREPKQWTRLELATMLIQFNEEIIKRENLLCL